MATHCSGVRSFSTEANRSFLRFAYRARATADRFPVGNLRRGGTCSWYCAHHTRSRGIPHAPVQRESRTVTRSHRRVARRPASAHRSCRRSPYRTLLQVLFRLDAGGTGPWCWAVPLLGGELGGPGAWMPARLARGEALVAPAGPSASLREGVSLAVLVRARRSSSAESDHRAALWSQFAELVAEGALGMLPASRRIQDASVE